MSAEPDFDALAILRALARHGVEFVVVGGYAVAAHGVIRATEDLDIVVARTWENAGRLGTALAELEATSATGAPTPLTREVLVRREDRLLDTRHGRLHLLHVVGAVPDYADLLPATVVEIDGERVLVATPDQLRAMKAGTGRAKDAVDLAELDAVTRPDGQRP